MNHDYLKRFNNKKKIRRRSKLIDKLFYSYTDWNGILGPGGKTCRYFDRDKFWKFIISISIAILIIAQIYSFFR